MKPYETVCNECRSTLTRSNDRTVHFCDIVCRSAWQRRAKPVTSEWLTAKYIGEGLNCTQIAAIVKRDPKSVWNWLKDFGIPTRPRGTYAPVLFKKGQRLRAGCKLSEAHKEQIRQARKRDGRIPCYVNGVHWTKFYGRHTAAWKGGISPERQAFYSGQEWISAAKAVWKRDDAICQRCGLDHRTIDRTTQRFHIHHIDSFMIRERRAVVENLVLVCDKCHRWIHSPRNAGRRFLGAGHN